MRNGQAVPGKQPQISSTVFSQVCATGFLHISKGYQVTPAPCAVWFQYTQPHFTIQSLAGTFSSM